MCLFIGEINPPRTIITPKLMTSVRKVGLVAAAVLSKLEQIPTAFPYLDVAFIPS
jgi:hypothetical protein